METLHIYAQACWHDEAWIAGNREGLTRLRDAIDKALLDGHGKSDRVFTADGEGYHVVAMKLADQEFGKLGMPYTAKIAAGGGTQWPWMMATEA